MMYLACLVLAFWHMYFFCDAEPKTQIEAVLLGGGYGLFAVVMDFFYERIKQIARK